MWPEWVAIISGGSLRTASICGWPLPPRNMPKLGTTPVVPLLVGTGLRVSGPLRDGELV